jgi:hypothetical protein
MGYRGRGGTSREGKGHLTNPHDSQGEFCGILRPSRARREVRRMLEPVLDHKPRGFSGRPLIALLFAVGMGSLAASMRVPPIIAGGVFGLVGYLWYRAEKPRYPTG